MLTISSSEGGGDVDGSEELLKKGPWTAAEDAVLVEYVRKHGEGNWNAVQRNTGLRRCGKSCRLRWANHLRPNLKKGPFSVDEQRLIIHLHSKLGNKWARISQHLPGRTDNEIKNFWNTRVKRRLRQGLSLYPNQNHSNPTESTKSPPHQPLAPPHSSYKQTSNSNNNTLSLFNPVSVPSSFFSLHPPTPFLAPQFLRGCPSTFLGCPYPSPSQMGVFQLRPGGFGFDSGQVPPVRFDSEGFNFDNLGNFELPSNQNVTSDEEMVVLVDKVKVDIDNPNVGRTKSGLLDDLLQEAQIKVANRGVKRERNDCGLQWDVSASDTSCTGMKSEKPEDKRLNFGKEVLPDILDLIPTQVESPESCHGGGENPVVSIDDQIQQGAQPPLPVLSTSDYEDDGDDWNPSCYTWDNLPTIC
ncbi:uncharacterized protein LOC141617458 [Silene latifolia]|uniref:uncharacterized protein LOC141617458 n=1 Tax=Silene latifolia TaxID=37657 RepID=UPI003D78460B